MKNKILMVLMFIFVPIVVIIFFYAIISGFKKIKPGLYFEYKCNESTDLSKAFGDNVQAKEAVCSGLYIPFGVKLNKKDYIKVLEKMAELNEADSTLKENMKALAKQAVEQTT